MVKDERNKGITLIALIVTIVVLLILAGVTINAISGSESAPAKANEAGQKNDIGAAKDDISLTVTNAKMQGMETAYVGNGVSAENASTTVGTEVIKAVAQKYQTNNQIGKATIEIDGFGTVEDVTGDATVSVYTTDFVVEGTITLNDGVLIWGEIGPNVPRIVGVPENLYLKTNSNYTINAKLKGTTGNIDWTSSDSSIVSVSNGEITTYSSVTDPTEPVTITASATGCESKTCTVTVTEASIWGTPRNVNLYGSEVTYLSKYEATERQNNANFKIGWKLFYRNDECTYIIADKLSTEYRPEMGKYSGKYEPYASYSGQATEYSTGEAFSKDTNKAKDLNPQLLKEQPGLFQLVVDANNSYGSLNKNMSALAWYCDTTAWADFECNDANVTGEYAIACPPIELYVKSYNASAEQDGENKLGTIATDFKGYEIPSVTGSIMTDTERGGIYAKTNKNWWLASPNGYSFDSGICVNGVTFNSYTIANTGYSANAVRPLVCIPNSEFDITNMATK